MTTPPDDGPAERDAAPFDPYRFGAPEQPVPPEYAPPGYTPPPPTQPGPGAAPGYGGYPPYGPPGYPPPGYPPAYPPPSGYAGGPPPLYQPPLYNGYPQPRTGNGKAIAALVLGILSILLSIFAFFDLFLIIPAIVFGSLGLADARRGAGGLGMARAGLICTAVGAVLAIVLTVFIVHRVSSCDDQYGSGSHQYNVCVRKGL
jgi:hypothetical protein